VIEISALCDALKRWFRPDGRLTTSNNKTNMNNGTLETSSLASHTRPTQPLDFARDDELSRAKRELLQAEVRLAKARAAAAAAEVDIKVFGARLKSLAK
jgi:hypothetical protein